LVARVV
jgi:hypothetical protein